MAYPNELLELPPFELWIVTIVAKDMAVRLDVVLDVISIIAPLLDYATAYQSMWAFGKHLQVPNAKNHLSIADSWVATTFEQECHSHSND